MAAGDQTDMLVRLRALLPPWFPPQGSATVLDGVLTGVAATLSFVYAFYANAQLQTRVKTATGAFLDLLSFDYFGTRLPRGSGEADASFQARIVKELVRPRVTRAAVIEAIEDATGYVPRVIEPWRPADVGAYDVAGVSYYDVDTPQSPFRWTNVGLKPEFFIEVPLPLLSPVGPNAVPSYDQWTMAFDQYGAFIDLVPQVSTAQLVYSSINAVRAAGVTAWVKFVSALSQPYWDEPGATWDEPCATWQ